MQHYNHLLEQAYQEIGDNQPAKALQTFREASVLKPDEPEPLIQLALLFEHFDDIQGAIHLLEKAVSIDSESAFAVLKLGLMHYETGDVQKSEPHLRKGTQLIENTTADARAVLNEHGHEDLDGMLDKLSELEETAKLGRELLLEITRSEQESPSIDASEAVSSQ